MGPAFVQTDAPTPAIPKKSGMATGLRVAKINKFRDYPLSCTRVFAPGFQIRLPLLTACGGVYSFDPPPNPRLGGGLGRETETNRISGPSAHGTEIHHKFFGRFVAR